MQNTVAVIEDLLVFLRVNIQRAEPILARFMDRDYEPNGAGGLFTITRTSIDMRAIDIWYQLMSWLNENEF